MTMGLILGACLIPNLVTSIPPALPTGGGKINDNVWGHRYVKAYTTRQAESVTEQFKSMVS